MYYQQGVFNCDYCIKGILIIQKHMKFATPFHPAHFCKTAVILDLLNTHFKLNQAVISGMVTVSTVVCFFFFFFPLLLQQTMHTFPVVFKNYGKLFRCNGFLCSILSFMFCKYWRSFDQFDLEMECNFAYKIAIKLLLKVF